MKHALVLFAALAVASCTGPAASDPDLCEDVIVRLCSNPRCDLVTQTLNVTNACIDELNARTHCDDPAFTFGTGNAPTRDRFLECRIPLIRAGDSRTTAPHCDDVDDAFTRCEDLVRFLNGEGQP